MNTFDTAGNAIVVAAEDTPLVKSMLRKVGFHVLAPGTANHPDSVDLAVVDADSPNPAAVVEKLHDLYPGARVLLLSEQGTEKLQQVPGFGHIRGALRKPFRRSQFVGTVLSLMEQRRVMTA